VCFSPDNFTLLNLVMKMIAKIDDRNVTVEMVQAMTAQELKAFENRLRSVAQG